jgi:hypothetical protein
MRSLRVEAITYAPTVFFHCQHCELTFQEVGIGERLRRQEAAEALPDDLAREYQALSDWSRDLIARFGSRVHLKVIDAASIEGVLASLRYRVFRYPAVVVDGTERFLGPDLAAVIPAVERRLATTGG